VLYFTQIRTARHLIVEDKTYCGPWEEERIVGGDEDEVADDDEVDDEIEDDGEVVDDSELLDELGIGDTIVVLTAA